MKNNGVFYWLCFVFLSVMLFSGCQGAVTKISVNNGGNVATQAAQGDVRVYSTKTSYKTPAGLEDYEVKISIKNNLVSDITATSPTKNEDSQQYQQLFLEGIKTQVIGKSLKDLGHVGVVNGASLTSEGYNQALDSIKSQLAG